MNYINLGRNIPSIKICTKLLVVNMFKEMKTMLDIFNFIKKVYDLVSGILVNGEPRN